MVPVIIAGFFVVGIIGLTIYCLADNDRIYGSIIAGILTSLLSFVTGAIFMFGLVVSEVRPTSESVATIYQEPALGYFFLLYGIIMLVVVALLVYDMRNSELGDVI